MFPRPRRSARHFPLRRLCRSRPRHRHRRAPLSHCRLRRAGSSRSGHSRGPDGRRGPGSGTCLGRSQILRRPTLARPRSYRHCRLSVPALQPLRQAARRIRSASPMARRRPHHRRDRSRHRLCRKCRRPHRFGICRGRGQPSRAGLYGKSGPVHGARSWRSPPQATAFHHGPRRPRPMRVTCPI